MDDESKFIQVAWEADLVGLLGLAGIVGAIVGWIAHMVIF